MTRRLLVLLTALLAFPAAAHAAWFPAAIVDGPNAEVLSVGNVDLARDGNGAVAYLRRDGVYVSRLIAGVWRGPERVDHGLPSATEVKVAVGDGNRIAVTWVADGMVYASVVPGGAAPGPFTAPVAIGGPGARSVDIDLGVNGAAYAIYEQSGDVRAARLQDATWTPVAPPLDVDPGLEAGTGALRPKVAVSAEGYAVATWGDRVGSDTRVWGRRITGLNLSVAPQLIAEAADSPDIDIEDDGSFAWVVYRQDVGGVSRTLGRRLVGSLFEPVEAVDGGLAATEPRVDINGRGVGWAVSQASGGPQVIGSWLERDRFAGAARIDSQDSAVPTKPEVASADRNDVAVAWRTGETARGRFKDAESAMGPEFTLSRPELGPVADPGVFISGDRIGDFAVAMVQGNGGARALTIAHYDRPPGTPFIESSQTYKRQTRPELRWRPGLELWGPQTFRVYMDGVLIGQATDTDRLVPATPLSPGRHSWQVEAVDQAGQAVRSRVRTLRIDSLPPRLTVRVTGRRAAGRSLKIQARARDEGGSGMHHVTVDYGDRSPKTRTATTRHRYRRGTFTLRVAAVDKAGNVTRKEVRLRIRR